MYFDSHTDLSDRGLSSARTQETSNLVSQERNGDSDVYIYRHLYIYLLARTGTQGESSCRIATPGKVAMEFIRVHGANKGVKKEEPDGMGDRWSLQIFPDREGTKSRPDHTRSVLF